MGFFSRLVDANSVPTHKKAVDISSPLTGKVMPLDDVPHAMFTERLFGEGVAIKPSGHQVLAPFSGTMLLFPELANQLMIKRRMVYRCKYSLALIRIL
jgi:PTS system glucose-specific IIA component